MSTFSKEQLLQADASHIPQIAEEIQNEFIEDNFVVSVDKNYSAGRDISITKGGIFIAILGMRTALKVSLIPKTDGVLFKASVGIFGLQIIPAIIAWYFFWPIILTQIWGLIQQSKLDDRALTAALRAIENSK